MKKIRSLLSIVMALSIVIGLPVNSAVYAAGIDVQSSETVQTDEENETTWQSDENDLWGEISDLEYFSHAQTVEDHEALMPQIEEIVTSSPEFEEGSLYYKDGALYWEVNDDPKCYDPVIRAQMNSGAPLSVQPITVPQSKSKLPEPSGYSLDDSGIQRSSAFPQEGAVDVCAFLPYSGTKGDNFSSLEGVAEKVADYTGGEVLCYKGEDATVDDLAKAVQSCAMVMIGSHGSNGAFGIITNKGINNTDKNSGHYADWGPRYYYDSENNKIFDYNLWMIDGTIISNHMTQDAPGNFVYSSSCMSMKTDRLYAPLRARGVSAVFGWSESVTSEGDCLDLSILTDLLCSRQTLAEAFVNMKKTVGCEWDPTWIDYTYDQAHNYAVAFPIIVSEEDEYPGQGNVNIIQTVKSTWKLPVRSDVPEKQVISLNTQYTNYVVAETRNKITNVTIAAGGLPKGMTMSYEDNRVVLNGKPTEKGYAVATYKITTEKKETITKPVGLLTADYSKVTSLSKSVEVTAPNYNKWSIGAFLDASDESEKKYIINIPLEFKAATETFAATKYSGYLPPSLEFGFDNLVKGSGYVKSQRSRVYTEARDDKYKDYYHATAPGQYGVTIDFVTRTGEVFRYSLDLTVKQNHIYTESKRECTYYINDSIGFNIDSWSAGAVVSVHITEGSLPPGIILANSWDKPFGFYGKPTVVGDYTVKFRIANYSDYYDYTYTFHIKPAFVKIKGDVKNVGDTLELEIGDVPYSPYSILWEASTDKEKWKPITSLGVDETYTTKPDDAKKYIRASICRMALGMIQEQHFSDARYINPLPELSGTVFYTSGIASNMKITTSRGGLLNDLYNKDPEKLHYQWQVKNNEASGWKDLDAETNLTYMPTDEMIGTQIRVKATYDGYSGAVYSTPREIHKRVNNGTPTEPTVVVSSPYNAVTVINAKVDQEYTIAYSVGSPDWTAAQHTEGDREKTDCELILPCEKDKVVFVYTRMRETDTYQSGMKTAYKVVYNGHTEYLQGLTFDKTSITTKVGDVTQLTVSPLPADFGKWDDSYTLSWFVNGSEVELYEDEDCTTPVTQHTMTSHKTVYVKGKTATSNVNVGVEKTVGYNDLKVAFCSVTVADEDGDFVLQTLNFDDVTVIPGEVTLANYTTYPTPAKVGLLTFEKNSGPDSEITILKSDKNDGTVNIVVPDDALPGTYYYGVLVDGVKTPVLSSITITVQPDKFNVVLDPDDGSGKTITKTVRNGAEYYLPDCPESFNVPVGYDFDGWDKGAVGSGIVVTEDITLKAQWKKHEHTMVYAARVEPTCTAPGTEEHYYCLMCGKLFEDAEGTIEAPDSDRFELPPKGHTPGKAVKENVIEADCTHEGSYDEVVYCTDCETELSREAKAIPAKGHTLEAVPEKAAACTEEGHSAYYRCTECGKFFFDEGAATELTDTLDTAVPALGHDWGEPEYTWSDDNSTVTAKRVCKNDPTHVETETVKTKSEENNGKTIFTAEFDNPAFRIQKKTAELETASDTDSKTNSDTDSKANSDTDNKTNSDTDNKTDPDTDSKTDSDTDSKTNPDTDSKTDPDTDGKTNSDTDSKTDPDTDSDTKSDTDKPKPNGIYGDIDGDGNITAGDALMILRTSVGLGTLTPEQILLADVDGDGDITANDALAVLRNSVSMTDNNLVGKPITE